MMLFTIISVYYGTIDIAMVLILFVQVLEKVLNLILKILQKPWLLLFCWFWLRLLSSFVSRFG